MRRLYIYFTFEFCTGLRYNGDCFARHELRENRVEINWYF